MRTPIEEATEALYSIKADIPRPDWAKIAMAWKSADFPFEVFDQWSSTGQSYDAKATKSTWKSVKADGGINISTLFYYAKQYGFDPRQSKADFKPLIEQAKQRHQKADKTRQDAAQEAAERANKLLDGCDYAPADHPYFVDKHITPPEPVWQYKEAIVIPVMDITGEVHTLQFIEPDGTKRFLKDGAIKGNFYQLLSRQTDDDPIVICEGFATGCTLAQHFTSDCSVIVAFNSGNLKPVARYSGKHSLMRQSLLLATMTAIQALAKKAALDAAQAVIGDVALPVFQEHESGSDWNDRWQLDREVRA